jgi:hypothetical protein
MLNRRHFLGLATTALACGMTGGSLAAHQAKTTTVTLTIDGMT